MKITRLHIENFRGIQSATLEDLGDVVVLAGPNGSGKSSVYDAIRLMKSAYGSYQRNEVQQWFNEFQINLAQDRDAFSRLAANPNVGLRLAINLEFHKEEEDYIGANAEALLLHRAWRELTPNGEEDYLHNTRGLALEEALRTKEPEITNRVRKELIVLRKELTGNIHSAELILDPYGQPTVTISPLLNLVFSIFEPGKIGIIDYHGAHRQYSRERLASLNVSVQHTALRGSQGALYNYNSKYSNIKGEMANLYVREALAKQAGVTFKKDETLIEALGELFATFFPDKEFPGPQPQVDGTLSFPVKIRGREVHDLDELSSGEKEILYGYLRLRSSAPRHSVILIDEPELHLNPRLIQGLPDFYYRHVAKIHHNQIWLVTHSDAILRGSIGRSEFSVFHMLPSFELKDGQNQAKPVKVDDDLHNAIIALVGDLSTFSPEAKVVIFEGEDSEFDLWMSLELFPDLQSQINAVSGTNKRRVRGLHELLEKLQKSGGIPRFDVYSITDMDSDDGSPSGTTRHSWNVYHIENHLLVPEFIKKVIDDTAGPTKRIDLDEVNEGLKRCAEQTISSLVAHRVSGLANRKLIEAVSTKISPDSRAISADLAKVLKASIERMQQLRAEDLSEGSLRAEVDQLKKSYNADVDSGNWKASFRGRDVLKRFVSLYLKGTSYENFRNQIIARMKDAGYQPEGMKAVFDRILAGPTQEGTKASRN